MTIEITYFPHGTTYHNEMGISSGWSDVELSDKGIKQSLELHNKIKNIPYNTVFCSDLKRSVDSAKLMFEQNIPIKIDTRLRECNFGIFNERPSNVIEPIQLKHLMKKFPEGESFDDVKARMNDFLLSLKSGHDNTSIAIVSHKVPQLALEVLLNNKTWENAIDGDWRKTGSWQPGWKYTLH